VTGAESNGAYFILESKGDFAHIPRGTVHTFRNEGETVARMLVVFAPAGMEKYMEEVFEPVGHRSEAPPPSPRR